MKYTPGPWEIHVANSTRIGFDIQSTGGKKLIAWNIQDGANARLIAAAPELLEACKAALVTLADDELYARCKETYRTLESAVTKAEGK